LNQRADFTSYLQQHGGMLAPLSSELESRAQRIKEVKRDIGRDAVPENVSALR
jgi:hypothetical protein